MYVEMCVSQLCKYILERNQYLEIICIFVYGREKMSLITHYLYILKNICDQFPFFHTVSSSILVKHTYQLDTVSPTRQSRLIVVYTKERC